MPDLPVAKKSLGQYWLNDQPTLEAMADAAALNSNDVVVEIGPGLGSLTNVLARRVKQVIAVEYDASLSADLPKRVAGDNLIVIHQDILRYDFNEVPPDYKVVANIPYYLTSNLLRVLSETSNPPQLAVLLLQKEVAQRICAEPGAMSLLSVTAQFYWQTELGGEVPAYLFIPPPKVDSQVVILRRREVPLFSDITTKTFFRLVRIGFTQRRKTLSNTLRNGLHLSKEESIRLLEEVGIDPAKRPQTLSLSEWYVLYEHVKQFMA